MVRFLCSMVIIFFVISCGSISTVKKIEKKNFPEDYVGTYEGSLYILQSMDTVNVLSMGLEIAKTESKEEYDWRITYGSDGDNDVRAYLLRKASSRPGHYHIDELNGIVLEAEFDGYALVSLYSVMDNLISVTYRFDQKSILFDIAVSRPEPSNSTGDLIFEGDTIPRVDIYPIVLTQNAELRRLKD